MYEEYIKSHFKAVGERPFYMNQVIYSKYKIQYMYFQLVMLSYGRNKLREKCLVLLQF